MNIPIYVKKENYLTEPYFFQNDNISKHTYIAQPVSSIGRAIYCIDIWNSERYNVGDEGTEEDDIGYTLYVYKNNTNIEKHYIYGKNIKGNVGEDITEEDKEELEKYKIIQYKKNKEIYTIALLKF